MFDPINLHVNFYNLQRILILAANDYSERAQKASWFSKFFNFICHGCKCNPDTNRVRNIKIIAGMLKVRKEYVKAGDGMYKDEYILLLFLHTLSRDVFKSCLPYLFDVSKRNDTKYTTYRDMVFYSKIMPTTYYTDLQLESFLTIEAYTTLCQGELPRLGLVNKDAINCVLATEPADSIAATPITFLCIKKFRKGTALDRMPIDLVRVLAKIIQIDVKVATCKQLEDAELAC